MTHIVDRRFSVIVCCLIFASSSIVAGCSNRPPRVTAPSVNPRKAASLATEQFDTTGDGLLSHEELRACGSLRFAAEKGADADGDGSLSADEIAQRIRSWTSSGVAMVIVPLIITLDGKPLESTEVELVPESFLGSSFTTARGKTSGGTARMKVADEDLPKQNRGLGAMYCAFYRVKLKHPSPRVQAKLDKFGNIGVEVAGDYRMSGLRLALVSDE